MSNVIYLNEICHPKQWETIPVTSLTKEGFPVYGANGIIGYYKEYNHEKPTLLITCRGATCGELNISNPFSYVTGNAMCLDNLDEEQADLYFLYYALKKRGFQDIISGTAQPQITREGLAHVKIPLPPLSEQKRIASLLARADRLRGLRRAAREQCDSLLQSVFLEMFEKERKKIKEVRLGTLTEVKTGGTPSRDVPEYFNGQIPWVKTTEVINEVIYGTSEKISEAGLKASNCEVFPIDTILLAMYGQGLTRGRTGKLAVPATTNQACAAILPSPKINTDYLWVFLKMSYNDIRDLGRGGNQPNLNLSMVRDLVIPLPPLGLQEEFARVVARVEALRARMDESARQGEALFQSLLAESFG